MVVPANSAAMVRLNRPGAGDSLEVSLPTELGTANATLAKDGTVVCQPIAGKVAAAVQILGDGSTRIQTISADENSPRQFTYRFGRGIRPVWGADGTVQLIADLGRLAVVVGTGGRAGAVDASGAPVATHNRIAGEDLAQVIEPSTSAAYPIVADPRTTATWWNKRVYFNKSETRLLSSGAAAVAIVARWIPDVTLSKVVASRSGHLALEARWALGNGQCLKVVDDGWTGAGAPPAYGGSEAGGCCR